MKLSAWAKVKLFQLAAHIVAIVGMVLAWDARYLAASLAVWFISFLFGGCIGAHRLWSHRHFEATKLMRYGTLWIGTLMGVGSMIGWVGHHRHHHAFSDHSREKDPYWAHDDYSFAGTVKAWVMTPHPTHFSPMIVKDLLRDKWVVFTHEHYFKILFAWMTVLLLVDPLVCLYGFFVPAALAYHSAQIPGVLGHRVGVVNYPDTGDRSRDCHWLNVFSLGESYQNTHHKFPDQVVFGRFDLAGHIIKRFLKARA